MKTTEKLAKFIYQVKYNEIPERIVEIAKERILDTLGAAIAGYTHWEYSTQISELFGNMDMGKLRIIGETDRRYSAARAAMINSTYAHAIELDDGHKNAGCHAGAVIVPTAMSIAASLGRSGKEVIEAVVAGYEVEYQIAHALSPTQIKKGFHPSSCCGVFGSFVAAGKLLKLDVNQLINGFGHAAMFSSGTMEATVSGQDVKCMQVGNAAYNGVVSAYMAKNDFAGCLTALDGSRGFFKVHGELSDVDNLFEGLGRDYKISDTYSKMYPTCRHAQPGIEAVMELIEAHNILPENVMGVNVGTHKVAYEMTGKIECPTNMKEAQFSIKYGVAIALVHRAFGIAHLSDEYYSDEGVRALASKVVCRIDESVQEHYPEKRGANIEILMKDGCTFNKTLFDLKGSPENPVGWHELEAKFKLNASSKKAGVRVQACIEAIKNLEKLETVQPIEEALYSKYLMPGNSFILFQH